ncbi:hypothetical protein MKQ70_22060 [Chitinophaga sedimenti]|nr:hypothetical protein [Chitinophaga sedimenti]
MFGEIGAWLYKGVGGILPNEAAPGFSDVLLEPHFVAGLDHFDAEHEGPYGLIQSSWKRTGDGVTYTAVIPANSTGTIRLEVPAGKNYIKMARRLHSQRSIK